MHAHTQATANFLGVLIRFWRCVYLQLWRCLLQALHAGWKRVVVPHPQLLQCCELQQNAHITGVQV